MPLRLIKDVTKQKTIREFYSNSMCLYVAQFNYLLVVINFLTCHINAFTIYYTNSLFYTQKPECRLYEIIKWRSFNCNWR